MLSSSDRTSLDRNLLLAALPSAEHEALVPELTVARLSNREVLTVCGQPMRHVVFPRGAVVSIVVAMEDGQMVEGATIWLEGLGTGHGATSGALAAWATSRDSRTCWASSTKVAGGAGRTGRKPMRYAKQPDLTDRLVALCATIQASRARQAWLMDQAAVVLNEAERRLQRTRPVRQQRGDSDAFAATTTGRERSSVSDVSASFSVEPVRRVAEESAGCTPGNGLPVDDVHDS